MPIDKLALAFIIIMMLLELRNIIEMTPALLTTLTRAKGALELEHNVNLARRRNTLAFCLSLVFVALAYRFALLVPPRAASPAPGLQLALTAGITAGYILLKELLYLVFRFGSRTSDYSCLVRHHFFNPFILYVTLAVCTAAFMYLFGAADALIRTVLLAEGAVSYIVYLFGYWQILRLKCSVFTTFLYLCALEFLPAGILIITCTR